MDSIHEVSIPVGSLSIIGMKGCEEMAARWITIFPAGGASGMES